MAIQTSPITNADKRFLGLTTKQYLFVKEYLVDFNGAQAYMRAGYKGGPDTAYANASCLLRLPKVAAALKTAMDDLTSRSNLTLDRVLEEIKRIALFDNRKLYRDDGSLKNPSELDEECGAVLAGVEVVEMPGALAVDEDGNPRHIPMYVKKVRTWDKNAALNLALRYFGVDASRIELTGKGGGPIQIEAKVQTYLPSNGRERVIGEQ